MKEKRGDGSDRVTEGPYRAYLSTMYDELLFADGHDNAILGVGERFSEYFVIYDKEVVLSNLMKWGMTDDEAEEFFSFNILGAWVGEHTPCFLTTT